MARPLLSDDLWEVIEPLLPAERPKPKGGRPRVPDRVALSGILFDLRSGLPWEMLPQEVGCGSGMTCWRRLREWQEAGVWDRLHRVLLDRLGRAGGIDWRRACLDSPSVPAKRMARPVRKGFHDLIRSVYANVSGVGDELLAKMEIRASRSS